MGVFGVDVSNWQSSFDFRNWEFAFIKATQGTWFTDGRFNQHLSNARANGCLVAAYHYQETSGVVEQVEHIKSVVPTDVPVIIDVERGSGGVNITKALVTRLEAEGYTVPFVYIPRWYWREIGSPDMSGLPPLWASWYPDYVARPREQALAMVPASAWSPYGGLNVAIMQFTSTPFDQDYFPGTRDQLAAILNGRAPGGGIGEDEVSWNELLTNSEGKTYSAGQYQTYTNEYVIDTLDLVKELETKIDSIESKVDSISVGEVDYDRLAAAVANMIFERLDVDIVRKGDA